MPTAYKEFAKVTLTSTPTDYYTVPAVTTAVTSAISLCNTGASVRAVTLLLGGKALLTGYSMAAKETLGLSLAHTLLTTEKINASQDAGADVDLIASGIEIT